MILARRGRNQGKSKPTQLSKKASLSNKAKALSRAKNLASSKVIQQIDDLLKEITKGPGTKENTTPKNTAQRSTSMSKRSSSSGKKARKALAARNKRSRMAPKTTKEEGSDSEVEAETEKRVPQKGKPLPVNKGRNSKGKGASTASKDKKKKKAPKGNSSAARSSRRQTTKKATYAHESEEEDAIDEDSSSEEESETKAKPSKRKNTNKKQKGAKGKKKTTKEDESEDDYEMEEEESASEDESGDESDWDGAIKPARKRKGKSGKGKSKKQKGSKGNKKGSKTLKEKIPPVSEMVMESIKALRDNPKKGSTLRSIKDTILLNWALNINMYNKKIKKFITSALEKGDIVRVKGAGFNGRFTVPGLKMKKKRKSKKLGKKYDEDEDEYTPQTTTRDEEREESKVTMEKQRKQRQILEAKLMAEKELRPKKRVIKKQEWDVEAIKGIKDKDDEKYYLVKWKGFSKVNWEPAENIKDCRELIQDYLDANKKKEAEIAKWKKLAEGGSFEPEKILDVKTVKGKRQFLIRWKGHGQESDRWEAEADLKCKKMIQKFTIEHEKELERTNLTRQIREAPKRLDRFVFASSKRVAKRNGGLGMSYAGMDED